MILFYLLTLALVQGVTEFLPISSSGHLVLVHALFGDTGNWGSHMVLDVAVHVGTLFSVLLYFRKDVFLMLRGFKDWVGGDWATTGARLNLYVLVSSIPVVLAGYGLHVLRPGFLLSVQLVAWTTLLFGVLLWVVDRRAPVEKGCEDMSFKDAFLIGCAQMLALVPGTSRSGITMTAARFLGYSRAESARYSLLLAIVAISGAGVIGGLDLAAQEDMRVGLEAVVAAFLAFVSGLMAIGLMMKWLERASFTPFALYRIVLGSGLLILLYTGVLS